MSFRKTTMIACDNPDCENEYEYDKEDPAPGYHLGKGFWVQAGGGPIPATYACCASCLAPAIDANIERALGRDPITGEPL
jgi:hypothetical protein